MILPSTTGQEFLISQIRACVPKLSYRHHKGKLGRLGFIGGCLEYTGAPYHAAMSACRTGCDVAYIFCSKSAAPAIKSYSPDLIVLPYMRTTEEIRESYHLLPNADIQPDRLEFSAVCILEKIKAWISSFAVLVIGSGLGRDPFILECTRKIIKLAREQNIPIVVDGDGLFALADNLGLIANYKCAILTPNSTEFERLLKEAKTITGATKWDAALTNVSAKIEDGKTTSATHSDLNPEKTSNLQNVERMARVLGNVTILRKGRSDIISDGRHTVICSNSGCPRRCSGQGDILVGMMGTFLAWNLSNLSNLKAAHELASQTEGQVKLSATTLTAWASCNLLKECAKKAYHKKYRSLCAADIIDHIGSTFHDIYEYQYKIPAENYSEF